MSRGAATLASEERVLAMVFRGDFPLPPETPVPKTVADDKVEEWFENHAEEGEEYIRATEEWERHFQSFVQSPLCL
jgi:hypothetical protein